MVHFPLDFCCLEICHNRPLLFIALQTSVLCKAAVHAGVILDELGGPIVVSQEKGVTLYKSSVANGLHSKR